MTLILAVCVLIGLFTVLAGALVAAEKVLLNYGICTIDINAGERSLEVEGGQTLLSAFYDNEVFIPSACGGRGSCAYCKVTVLSGGGKVLPTEVPYLSRTEQRSGVRLACQVKVREDIETRIPEELLHVKLFSATVESTRYLTHDIKELRFRLDDAPEIEHRAGQYIQVEAPSPEGPVYRAYSISSPEYEHNIVELNVRLVPGGIGSTHLHNLEVGDKVSFTGPYGEFRLSEDPSVEVVCVGGGCGMAPMKCIIYSLYARWPERSCWLFFGCRTQDDVFYLEEFRELQRKHPNFHVVYALSDELEPGPEWEGETGFIHLSVDKYLELGKARQAFLCGPPPMIEAVMNVLADKEVGEEDIFYDKF